MIGKEKAALIAATFATVVSAIGISTMVGRTVHTVELVTLFAGGFGSGASVAAAIAAHRKAREAWSILGVDAAADRQSHEA
jgi:hypothetical protein